LEGEAGTPVTVDPTRSPTTLAATEIRLRRHVRPFFGDRPIEAIQPILIRQWQNQLPGKLGYESLMACRSILFRILQLAEDEGAITTNPLRRVPPPKRRADPEKVLGQTKRRAYTPEEAGRLLALCPLFWWDHVLVLLGTGLRFGEFAGLRRRWIHLERTPPVLQVVDVRYQAGRFGSGFNPDQERRRHPRDPARPLVVEAIRSQLPPGTDPEALVFAGPRWGQPRDRRDQNRALGARRPSHVPDRRQARRPRPPPAPRPPRLRAHLLDLAGGRRHPGPRDR
jgi:integrase